MKSGQKPTDNRQSIVEIIMARKSAWDAQGLAKLLDTTSSNILRKAKLGQIPSYRVFGSVKFDPVSVGRWLESTKIA